MSLRNNKIKIEIIRKNKLVVKSNKSICKWFNGFAIVYKS